MVSPQPTSAGGAMDAAAQPPPQFPAPPGSPGSPAPQPPATTGATDAAAVTVATPPSDDDAVGATVAAPTSADAPFLRIPVNFISVVIVGCVLAFSIIAPLVISDRGGVDKYALFCLLPAALCALYVGIFKRDEVHFRQLFVRYALGWVILTPMSWLFACLIIMICVSMVLLLHALLPLPGIVFGVLFYAAVTVSIVSMETVLQVLVMKRHDSVEGMQNPRMYPYYAASIALGMSSASCYYLVLFIRSLVDAAHQTACREQWEGSEPDHVLATPPPTVSGSAGMNTGAGPVDSVGATSSPAPHAHTSGRHRSTRHCASGGGMSSEDLIVLIVAATLLIQPMMMLASYHLGLIAARAQTAAANANRAAGTAVAGGVADTQRPDRGMIVLIVIRAAFLFLAVFGSAFLGPITLLLLVAVIAGYFAVVKWYERSMPRAYLERVGYLNLFGYGSLPQSDDVPDTPAAGAAAAAGAGNAPHPAVAAQAARHATEANTSSGAGDDEMHDV